MASAFSLKQKTLIGIPSYGRARNTSKFCTFEYMSDNARNITHVYVEPEERLEYEANVDVEYFEDASRADYPKFWGSIMDLIMDDLLTECDHLVLMDDDLSLAVRPNLPIEPTYYEEMGPTQFNEMLEELRLVTTSDCPLASAQYRQFCQGKIDKYSHNQRISMIWSLNSKFFLHHPEFRFYRSCQLPFMTDYHFFLNLLAHGHSNVCINKYTKDDKPNADGGESSKRTIELMKQSALALEKEFPGFVTAYKKKSKNNWEDGMYGVRMRASALYKKKPRCSIRG